MPVIWEHLAKSQQSEGSEWPTAYVADTDGEEADKTHPWFLKPLDLQLFDPGEKEDLAFSH